MRGRIAIYTNETVVWVVPERLEELQSKIKGTN